MMDMEEITGMLPRPRDRSAPARHRGRGHSSASTTSSADSTTSSSSVRIPPQGGQPPPPGGGKPPLVPGIVELKLVRRLQMDLNGKIRTFMDLRRKGRD